MVKMFKYAEISRVDGAVRFVGTAPFLPEFLLGGGIYCVDITNADPMPQTGWIYDPETNTFSEPAPEAEPDPYEGYIGDLVLGSASGGTFTAPEEINATVGQRLRVTGAIERGGELLPIDMHQLRLPILPTDLGGQPIASAQPSMAAASIAAGIVSAHWTPEFTGTYAITERGLNVRLPEGQRLKFKGLQIFVLPAPEA